MYSIANSLSPMMFGKSKGRKEARKRSRSLENILDHADGPVAEGPRAARAGTAQPVMNIERPQWKELNLVKSTSPVVTCVLPAVARDFVCSALLAVGATPLIVEGKGGLVWDIILELRRDQTNGDLTAHVFEYSFCARAVAVYNRLVRQIQISLALEGG